MGYQAGNLELSILGFSEKAVAAVDLTAKALRRLASAVDAINNTQFVFAGQKLEVLFTKIANATNSINTTNITDLASAAKSLSSISKLSNLGKMDFEKVGKGFNTLAVAIQPFLNKVKEAEASLTALDGILRRTSSKKIQGLLGGGDTKGNRSSNGIFSFAKRFASIYMLRRMGRFMGNLVKAGSDYYETLNLWQVAMRGNLDTADQFINKMQKAYGISSKTLMNAQAIFRNMIGSLGQISDATAYALSEALVQMSVDFSSLYNVKLESAFQKMQSMLAGQVRPIRSAGLDMTETTLFMFYQQLGGTKTMRQLNRTEKQLLSILAVYQQMGSAGALGDMTKTLNQFANQSRMLTEYWKELKTWSGLLLKDLIDQSGLLIKINAFLITTTEIVKAIAQAKGIGDENFLTGMFETAELTNDEIDKLQGKLLDFDKFRSLEGAATSPLAIDEKLLQAISGYSSKIDQAENAAQKLAESWLTSLGFIYDAETGTWQLSEDIEQIGTLLSPISDTVEEILGLYSEIPTSIIKELSPALIPILGILDKYSTVVEAILKFLSPIIGMVVDLLGVISPILTVVDAISWLLSVVIIEAIDTISWLSPLVLAPFEAILKVVQTIAELVRTIFEWDWGSLLGNLANIWDNWKISDLANTKYEMPSYAGGASDIDSGTIFRAGEFGKTEAVYTGSNGKTNVANVRQMEQAFYNALSRHSREGNGTIVVQAYLDGDKVYENTTARARARGNIWAKA
jgi:hypothetical protein